MNTAGTRCSIFCRVIDNFGDAGVCWRLAKQLGAEYQWQVTLYIDEWSLLTKLADPNAASGVKVARWQDISKLDKIPDVVIEAFACELPPNFVKAMANTPTPPVWINLEYLSAEAWVESAHLLASPHSSTGLQKYFYFPGFSGKTGGLLREPDYEIRRAKFRRSELLALLDVAPDANAILISYFAYANSPRRRLIEELSVLPYLTHLLEPGGTGAATFIGNLTIQPIPFLPQTTYDELLWACDINFVRGEDSFVRAQWAGKPFVWNTYPQENDTHLEKLEAFMDRFLSPQVGAGDTAILRKLWRAWNTDLTLDVKSFIESLPEQRTRASQWQKSISAQPDLAMQLVEFCDKLRGRLN